MKEEKSVWSLCYSVTYETAHIHIFDLKFCSLSLYQVRTIENQIPPKSLCTTTVSTIGTK